MGIGWVIDNGFSAHIDNPVIKGMKHKTNPVFPEGFLWGASSAAWQCEGATLEGGRTQAIIDLNSQTKKPYTDNSVACDHYHHYKEDVALMKECGFTNYRFSLSWSRIIPAADRTVNPEGIAFYNSLMDELKAAGIEPIITLYHYNMLCWVDEKFGGWLGVSKGCTNWFKEKWQVNHIMNLCHARAVLAPHELVKDGKIGPVPGYVPIYPASAKPEDQIGAMNAEELTQKIWDDLYDIGLAIQDGVEVFGFNFWSFMDLLSTGNGMAKRYGIVYVNRSDEEQGDLKRYKKDSFAWYSKLIRSNGQEWGCDMEEWRNFSKKD